MSIFLRGACALLVGVVLGGPVAAEENGSKLASFVEGADGTTIEQVSCNGCDPCGPTCDLGCGPAGAGLGAWGAGQVYVGAEWLNVRANFSEATAYRVQNTVTGEERFEQFDMNYGSSYRVYGGYRWCECGCDIQFAYTSFDSDGEIPTATNDPTNGIIVTPPYEVTLGNGDMIVGTADVEVDNYDIGFSKTIPLGCPLQCAPACGDCGDCASCCDPCGCGPWCPAWDITWSGGIRVANVDSTLSYESIRAAGNTAAPAIGQSNVSFDGVGLRFGLAGRRYFGRRGLVSAYVKGDISLLLGDVEYSVATQPGLPTVSLTSTEVIPVTEIEAGLTGYLTQNLQVSVGYLLSAWHDLGHRAEYNFIGSGSQIISMDDANLMTFDGLFVRGELAF